jgi:hypothetical protein
MEAEPPPPAPDRLLPAVPERPPPPSPLAPRFALPPAALRPPALLPAVPPLALAVRSVLSDGSSGSGVLILPAQAQAQASPRREIFAARFAPVALPIDSNMTHLDPGGEALDVSISTTIGGRRRCRVPAVARTPSRRRGASPPARAAAARAFEGCRHRRWTRRLLPHSGAFHRPARTGRGRAATKSDAVRAACSVQPPALRQHHLPETKGLDPWQRNRAPRRRERRPPPRAPRRRPDGALPRAAGPPGRGAPAPKAMRPNGLMMAGSGVYRLRYEATRAGVGVRSLAS